MTYLLGHAPTEEDEIVAVLAGATCVSWIEDIVGGRRSHHLRLNPAAHPGWDTERSWSLR